MDDIPISSLCLFSPNQTAALKRGRVVNVSDVLFVSLQDLAKKCRLPPQEAQAIVNLVCQALDRPPQLLHAVERDGSAAFTTGDEHLNKMLGGGIRTSMVWEIAGEGASGKTQLALQLALLVQLPPSQGGLSGSTCYLTTSSTLPTPRLVELLREHPLLANSSASLARIQTKETKSIETLLFVLSNVLPVLVQTSRDTPAPVKLLVIDTFADLLLEDNKTSSAGLAERSKHLSAVAAHLHTLAHTHQLAVVVINQVVDVWERELGADRGAEGDLIYADQARFFNRADNIAGESRKSASLGLVWANQINARIMLSRTGRRRYVDDVPSPDPKRRRVEGGAEHVVAAAVVRTQDILVRRLSIIFSSVSSPDSVDFFITSRGVETSPDVSLPAFVPPSATPTSSEPLPPADTTRPLMDGLSVLDVASAENELHAGPSDEVDHSYEERQEEDEDEDDAYWKEFDDIDGLHDLPA